MPRVKDGAIELNRLLESSFIAGAKGGQLQDQAEKGAWMVAEAFGWKKSATEWRTAEEYERYEGREKRIDVTPNFIRVRVRNPRDFKKGSFRTVTLNKRRGIYAVMGRLKGQTTLTRQAILFERKKGWNKKNAEKWVRDHGMKPVD